MVTIVHKGKLLWLKRREVFPTLCGLLLAGCCALLFSLHIDLFIFDRTAITSGQPWRLLTGHFTHSSMSHLFWDFFAFSIAVIWLSRYSQRCLSLSIILGVVSVDIFLVSGLSSIHYYCGLSGILFAPLLLACCFHAQYQQGVIAFAPLVICMTKVAYDVMTQSTVFVTTDWQAYPESHMAGAFAGILAYMLSFLISPK